ncbi:hypothetical protein CVIRNUC_003804 [Coccomyxa viridis]|uniref:Activator of Hsp90 ATPase AHSA1-like N-terminal domain-containing protein n=1 Tax=Coccomyxa viridis TaxID=1274662 RepID=A0AAV1HZM6_9CHLO|nr:hypothetical protein CVIRNUC_003804 [Coccomyxa viridis]
MPGREESEYASKLHQQAESKAECSYSYWAAGQCQSTASFQERKLEAKELAEQARREKAASAQGVSVWNQAGTFEERDCTAFAKEQLKMLINGLEHKAAGCLLRLGSFTSIEGEATVWVVRSNKRAGFDFTIEAAWAIEHPTSGAEAKGSLKLPNVTPDDLDELADMMEVQVSEAAGWQDAELRRLVRRSSEPLAERLGRLQQLLKER